jgi:hypothetical protein
MMKQTHCIRLSVVVLLAAWGATVAPAQTSLTGQAAMKFLGIGVGARAAGLGYSFVTFNDDVSSIFWNPAGIAQLSGTRAFVDVNQWIADVTQLSLAGSHDFGDWGVVGLSFMTMDYGEIQGTAIELSAVGSGSFEYVDTGPVKVSNYVIGLTYARAISSQFSVGGQIKYVYSGLGSNTIMQPGGEEVIDNTVSTLAFDVGTTYDTGFRGLVFSMSVRNWSREIRYPRMTQGFYLPLVFTLGVSIDAVDVFDPSGSPHSLIVAANGLHPTDYLEKACFGLEYAYDGRWFLRSGYKVNYSIEDWSFGVGARMPVGEGQVVQFDYSYSLMQYFSGVQRLSLSVTL